jgi:hypothetical protein
VVGFRERMLLGTETQARLGAHEVHTVRTRLGDTSSSVYSEYTYYVTLSSYLDVHILIVSILHPYKCGILLFLVMELCFQNHRLSHFDNNPPGAI